MEFISKTQKILKLETGESNIQLKVKHAQDYITKKIDRDSGTFKNGRPDTLVIHYTGSTSKAGAIQALYASKSEVSAHFVVDVNGEITQLLPLDKIAWHAGESQMGNRSGINHYSIGIEIVNPGYLSKASDGKNFYTAFNEKISPDKAIAAKHKNENDERYWHVYDPRQLSAVNYLCLELSKLLPIKYVVGHDEISPGRKVDPGPLYPIQKLRDIVLNLRRDDEARPLELGSKYGYVSTSYLNIRETGDTSSKKIALPLTNGTKVEILEAKEGWYKVKANITGWVSSKFVDS